MITDKQVQNYLNQQEIQGQESQNIQLIIVSEHTRLFIQIFPYKKGLSIMFKIIFQKGLCSNQSVSIFYFKKINKRSILVSRNSENQNVSIHLMMRNNQSECVQSIFPASISLQQDIAVSELSQKLIQPSYLYDLIHSNNQSTLDYSNIFIEQLFQHPFQFIILTETQLHLVIQFRPIDLLYYYIKTENDQAIYHIQLQYGYTNLYIMLLQIFINKDSYFYFTQNTLFQTQNHISNFQINHDQEDNIDNTQVKKVKCEESVEISCKSLLLYYKTQSLDSNIKNSERYQKENNQKKNELDIFENYMMNQRQYNEYGRALINENKRFSVYFESILVYYMGLVKVIKDQYLINSDVYNYKEYNKGLSSLDNKELEFMVERLKELLRLIIENNQSKELEVNSRLVQKLSKYYNKGIMERREIKVSSEVDLFEEQKMIQVLTEELKEQIEWLEVFKFINTPDLRQLVEYLEPEQIQTLLNYNYHHLLSSSSYVIKIMALYYLQFDPQLFSLKANYLSNHISSVISLKEIHLARAFMSIRIISTSIYPNSINNTQQQQQQQQQLNSLNNFNASQRQLLINFNNHDQDLVKLFQDMDYQTKIIAVNKSIEVLKENSDILDFDMINKLYEYLDILGGYVQFNQLLLSKLAHLDSQSSQFMVIYETIISLNQNDRKGIIQGPSKEQVKVIFQEMLSDLIEFNNLQLNQEMINYFYSHSQFDQILLFPSSDIDHFINHNNHLNNNKFSPTFNYQNHHEFIYRFYLQSNQFSKAFTYMKSISNTQQIPIQQRIYSSTMANEALIKYSQDLQEVQLSKHQLQIFTIQQKIFNTLVNNHNKLLNDQILYDLNYKLFDLQGLHEICEQLNFYEGQLFIYDISQIDKAQIQFVYKQLFNQILQNNKQNEGNFINELQNQLLRIKINLHSNQVKDLKIIVEEIENINKQHQGYVKYFRKLSEQNNKNEEYSPYWLVVFIAKHFENFKFNEILDVYIDLFNNVQQQIIQNTNVSKVIEIMYPLNSLQAIIENYINETNNISETKFNQEIKSFFIISNRIAQILKDISKFLKSLEQMCIINHDYIEFSAKSNMQIEQKLDKVTRKLKIIFKI